MSKKSGKINKLKVFAFGLLGVMLVIVLFIIFKVPSISLQGNAEISIRFGEKYTENGYSATLINQDVSDRVKIDGHVDENKVGEYNIKYTIKNLIGSDEKTLVRKVIVYDNVKPSIELVGGEELLKIGDDYKELGYKAYDNYDGDITDKVIIQNNIDNTKEGEYYVVYTVSDSSLNKESIKRKVSVYDFNAKSIPILTYHNFMTREEQNKYAFGEKYTISTETFEKQLKYLKDNGYNSIALDDFYSWYIGRKTLDEKSFVLVIDDGNVSAYYKAIPLIEKYGFNATVFVITGRIKDVAIKWDPSKQQFFNNSIIEDIYKNHQTIHLASHTHYLHANIDGHCALATKSSDEIYDDIMLSKDYIKSDYLAYPFGCYTNESMDALKRANYRMAFTFGENARATKGDNIYAIRRININSQTTMGEFISWLEE